LDIVFDHLVVNNHWYIIYKMVDRKSRTELDRTKYYWNANTFARIFCTIQFSATLAINHFVDYVSMIIYNKMIKNDVQSVKWVQIWNSALMLVSTIGNFSIYKWHVVFVTIKRPIKRWSKVIVWLTRVSALLVVKLFWLMNLRCITTINVVKPSFNAQNVNIKR
jgi:hypothetical protein